MWVPFLGEAYSRACEYTADRMAVAYTEKPNYAIQALTVLAAGRFLYKHVNKEEYLKQYNRKKGFFIVLTELLSTHPAIPRRIFEIETFIGKRSVPLEKKSKLSVILILLSTVLALALLFWTTFSFISDVKDFGATLFLPGETTPLMDATFNNDIEEIKILLKEGADPNEQEEEYGSTALITAADNDQIEVAKILLEYGANPNLADYYGYNPLIGAVYMENKEMIQILLEAGADPYLEDEEGMSAISYAEDLGYDELVIMMKNYK
jgi:hypothetical protein